MKKHLMLHFASMFILCQTISAHASGNISATSNKIIIEAAKIQEDTTAYIKTSLANQKAKYHGKELNELLNNSKYPVKSYTIVYEHKPGGNGHFISLRIYFEDTKSTDRKLLKNQKFLSLDVYFDEPVERKNAMAVYVKSFGVWGEAEKAFYGKLHIRDLKI